LPTGDPVAATVYVAMLAFSRSCAGWLVAGKCPPVELDHIVVTAPNLKVGVEWVRDSLGRPPELGGAQCPRGHAQLPAQAGQSEYLEVIAANPTRRNRPAALVRARPAWSVLATTPRSVESRARGTSRNGEGLQRRWVMSNQ